MMRVVYIAGKFRGATPWQVQQNVRAAEEAALAVWRMGLFALCPHKNTEHFDKELPDDVFVEGTKEMLRRSDAVLLVPGWTASVGALGELAEARRLGLPVFGVRGDYEEQTLGEALAALARWSCEPPRPRDLVRYELVVEWRDRCVELERQLAEIVGALGLEVRGGAHERVPAESLAEARRIVGAGGEDSVLGQVLDRIDSGLRCTVGDFLGEALYRRAAAAAGGGWAEQIAEEIAERAAEEAAEAAAEREARGRLFAERFAVALRSRGLRAFAERSHLSAEDRHREAGYADIWHCSPSDSGGVMVIARYGAAYDAGPVEPDACEAAIRRLENLAESPSRDDVWGAIAALSAWSRPHEGERR